MITPQAERGIRLPLVSVVQRTLTGMGLDMFHDGLPAVRPNWQRLDLTVTLDDAKDDNLARRTPTAFAFSNATKGGFVAFQLPFKGFTQFLRMSTAGAQKTVEAFRCRTRCHTSKSLTVDWNTQGKPLQQPVLCAIGEA